MPLQVLYTHPVRLTVPDITYFSTITGNLLFKVNPQATISPSGAPLLTQPVLSIIL